MKNPSVSTIGKKLVKNKGLFRRFFEEAPIHCLLISPEGLIVDLNKTLFTSLYYNKEELVGKPLRTIYAPESRARLNMLLTKWRRTGRLINEELVMITKRGEKRAVLLNAKTIQDRKERITYLIISQIDITGRKEEEKKFRFLSSAIEQSTEGIAMSDLEGHLIFVNDAFAAMHGYTPSELKGKHISIFHTPDQMKIVDEVNRQIKETGEFRGEVWHARRDGSVFASMMQNSLLQDESGCPIGIIATLRDITERKKTEKKIQDYQKKLRSLASKLATHQEKESRKIAVFIHDQIGQRLALTKIKLEALNKWLSDRRQEIKIVKEIRSLIEETIQDTRMLTFDLSPPILHELGFEQSIRWLVEQFAEKYNLQFDFKDDGRSKPLDENIRLLLFQAARELLTNVVKHSQAKRIKVSLSREVCKIRISVEDDGVGFDSSIVQPYSAKTGAFGLFNIRESLRECDGRLKIQSEVGAGTQVLLIAPLAIEKPVSKKKK